MNKVVTLGGMLDIISPYAYVSVMAPLTISDGCLIDTDVAHMEVLNGPVSEIVANNYTATINGVEIDFRGFKVDCVDIDENHYILISLGSKIYKSTDLYYMLRDKQGFEMVEAKHKYLEM